MGRLFIKFVTIAEVLHKRMDMIFKKKKTVLEEQPLCYWEESSYMMAVLRRVEWICRYGFLSAWLLSLEWNC